MVTQILQITDDTVFKRHPLQAIELPAEEKFEVSADKIFEIDSYAYAEGGIEFDGHIRVALKNSADWVGGINTWYVYNRHVQVLADGKVVYPQEDQIAILVLKVIQDTQFKRTPVPAILLPEQGRQKVPKDSVLMLHSYAFANAQGSFNNHIKIALKRPEDYINGWNTWYVYNQHAQVLYDSKVVYPLRRSSSFSGTAFKLPGNTSTFFTDQPIIPGGSLTWGEATRNGERIPQLVNEVNDIISLARQLQRARNQIGKPFNVTSWYRPEPFNTQAGGVPNSQHLTGSAVDFWVEGFTGRQLAFEFTPWWEGGIGVYAGARSDIVHLDVGPKRTWGF
jgi:Peptidase M15